MLTSKWFIITVVAVLVIAGTLVTLDFLFPPRLVVENMGGPYVKGGIPKHGFLGVDFDPDPKSDRCVVHSVERGGPAAKAGLQVGDIITAADDATIGTSPDLRRLLSGRKPGEVVRLRIERDGKALTVDATLVNYAEMEQLRSANKPNGKVSPNPGP